MVLKKRPSCHGFERATSQSWFWVPVRLPGLNELLDVGPMRRHRRKQEAGAAVVALARSQGFVPGGSVWTYLVVEPNRKRDACNCLGAVKVIEDALVRGGLLQNDSRRHVEQIAVHLHVSKNYYGCLVVSGETLYSLGQMIALWAKGADHE